MSADGDDTERVGRSVVAAVERMNEQWVDAVAENVDAQARLADAWLDAVEESLEEEYVSAAADGYRRAYEIWMEAAERTVERTGDAVEGDDVPIEEFRDRWLSAANESAKAIMGTSAFAHLAGRSVEESLDLRTAWGEASEDVLREVGIATTGDVREVGERLVELERRQHTIGERTERIEERLERIGDAVTSAPGATSESESASESTSE